MLKLEVGSVKVLAHVSNKQHEGELVVPFTLHTGNWSCKQITE